MVRTAVSHGHGARMIGDIFAGGIGWQPSGNSHVMTANEVDMVPAQVPFLRTADRLGFIVHAAGTGNVRVGIYRDNGDTPVGGELVVQSASVAVIAGGQKQEVVIVDTILIPGLYWFAIVNDTGDADLARPEVNWRAVVGGTLIPRKYTVVYANGLTDPCPAVTIEGEITSMFARVE